MAKKKSVSLQEQVKGMSVPELKMELRITRTHIDWYSFGRFELLYEDLIVQELTRRGFDVPGWDDGE